MRVDLGIRDVVIVLVVRVKTIFDMYCFSSITELKLFLHYVMRNWCG